MAQATDGSAFVRCAMCLRTIFYHDEIVIACECHQTIHITRPSGVMNRNNRFSVRS